MTEESNQYQIVADLLARQDSVLLQLDELSSRIDAAIKEIAGDRESLAGDVADDSDADQSNDTASIPMKRAA